MDYHRTKLFHYRRSQALRLLICRAEVACDQSASNLQRSPKCRVLNQYTNI
jgi:hypothetical protein